MKAVCGLDVHKDNVYLCILNEFGELIEKVLGVLTFQLEDMRDEGYQPIVELQIYNLSIFGNMNAVCLAALQDFFFQASTELPPQLELTMPTGTCVSLYISLAKK